MKMESNKKNCIDCARQ